MSRSSGGEPKKEDAVTVALIMIACLLAIVLLIWIVASPKIVNFWTPKLYTLSKMWLWLPGAFGESFSLSARESAVRFYDAPRAVKLIEFVGFVNVCAWPITLLMSLGMLGWLSQLCVRKPPAVQRKFKPQDLAEKLSFVFTGTAPVLHLRKALAQDKEPYWRRQTFPHEVLLKELVNGKPMVKDDKMVDELAIDYFRGLQTVKTTDKDGNAVLVPKKIGGRLCSRMVGLQVVDLLTDRGKKIVFPDRFSSAGKVIFALLCAKAFGGKEGIADYEKARDQLNNSARGAAHGFANLTVAQWLFDKYRTNETARQLFAIHHWEHTYLFELSFHAKKQGKCVDSEFLWLKPMSRFMFYAMNTVGRLTPHTESAATFAQHAYERRVARRGRLPLVKNVKTGLHEHVIYVEKARKGLNLEWERWRDGDGDDDQWWRSEAEWTRLNGARIPAPTAPPPELNVDTEFDKGMRADSVRQVKAADDELAAAIASERAALGV